MSCWHYYLPTHNGDTAFTIDASRVTFGPGALAETGAAAADLGLRRVALFTDPKISRLPISDTVRGALQQAGLDVALYDEVRIEPSDASFLAAARFVREGRFDGCVSLGGGSVMDTCKAALLYATYPADFLTYAAPPLGAGQPVPGPLPPHIACPTTSGTGSECTGIAVCEVTQSRVKLGLAHRALRPTLAFIDPACTVTLPAGVVAASGCDVLCHALESYTARPYTSRPRTPGQRPMSQGANPWSDLGSLEALRLCGQYLLRAVADAADHEARTQMLYAATLAGIAFGNAGVHVPHAMAYAVAGLCPDYHHEGYPPDKPLLPHGVSVILSAPAALRFTARACPDRHLAAAQALGADARGAGPGDAAEVLVQRLYQIMRAAGLPGGIGAVGYREADVPALCAGTALQGRLLRNAPGDVDPAALEQIFHGALRYW